MPPFCPVVPAVFERVSVLLPPSVLSVVVYAVQSPVAFPGEQYLAVAFPVVFELQLVASLVYAALKALKLA